jgi:hypothetical protein
MNNGKGNRNLHEILQYAIKSKRFVGGLCKLERDGSLTKINGQVFAIKTTKSGLALAMIDNFLGKKRAGQKKKWQAVLVKNIMTLTENRWEHKRVA